MIAPPPSDPTTRFLQQWEKKIPRVLAPLAKNSIEGNDIDLGTGMLPAAALWAARKALRDQEDAAYEALKRILLEIPGGAESVLRAVQEWKEKWDLPLAASQLALKSSGDARLHQAMQTLVDYFNVTEMFIRLVLQYRAPQVDPNSINIQDIKANIVNVGGVTDIHKLVIALQLPPGPASPPLLRSKVFYGALSLVLLSSALAIYQFIFPFFKPKPHLSGDFNVAIAQFTGTDARQASDLSDSVYKRLVQCTNQQSDAPDCPEGMSDASQFDIQVLTPAETGTIKGKTVQERAGSAEKLAEQVNADLVVNAILTISDAGSELKPEIFLSNRQMEDAQELSGYNSFGTGIQVELDISANTSARQELRDKLILRTDALKSFVFGLNHYTRSNFTEANRFFEAAANSAGWNDSEGKEVLYMFLGNISGRLKNTDQAEKYYQHALRLNPGYSRALLGIAEVQYVRSNGGCNPDQILVDGVKSAIAAYENAGQAEDQPPLAEIPAKVRFKVARAYLCLSQAQKEDHINDAEGAYKEIILLFEAGNMRLRYLASESHADLGLIYLPIEGDGDQDAAYQKSLAEYQKAIELVNVKDTERQAVFYSMVGYIQWQMNDPTNAKAAYDKAILLDPNRAGEYQKEYEELVSGTVPIATDEANNKNRK